MVFNWQRILRGLYVRDRHLPRCRDYRRGVLTMNWLNALATVSFLNLVFFIRFSILHHGLTAMWLVMAIAGVFLAYLLKSFHRLWLIPFVGISCICLFRYLCAVSGLDLSIYIRCAIAVLFSVGLIFVQSKTKLDPIKIHPVLSGCLVCLFAI